MFLFLRGRDLGAFGLFGSLLLHLGRKLAVGDGRQLAQGAHGAGGNANAAAVDADGLQVHVLAALGRDIRVATRIHGLSAFTGDGVDAGHMVFAEWALD